MNRLPLTALVFSILCVLAPESRAGGQVHVVEPGAPFSEIQDAVTAAADSDVVLVRSGSYASFEVVDKELSIVADAGATVWVQGAVRVSSLALARDVVISGLHATGDPGARGDLHHGLVLRDNLGSVRLVGCTFEGSIGGAPTCTPGHGAFIENSTDVAFSACLLRGRSGDWEGGSGLELRASRVALHDSVAEGGDGGPGLPCTGFHDGGNGGAGIRHRDSLHVFVQNTECRGGDGGREGGVPMAGECLFPGAGGNGVRGVGANPATLGLFDSPVSAGVTAPCTPNTCNFVECPPSAVNGTHGPSRVLAGSAPQLEAPRVVREGETLELTFHGRPGDRVGLSVATESDYVVRSRAVSLVAREGPALVLLLGTLDASGSLTRSWTVPNLGPGEDGTTLFLQALHRRPQGVGSRSGLASVVILGQTF